MAKVWNQKDEFCSSTKLYGCCTWRICNLFCVKQKLTPFIEHIRNSAEYKFCYSLDTEQKFKIQSRYSICFLYDLLNTQLPPIPVSSLPSCVQPTFTRRTLSWNLHRRKVLHFSSVINYSLSIHTPSTACISSFFGRLSWSSQQRDSKWIWFLKLRL